MEKSVEVNHPSITDGRQTVRATAAAVKRALAPENAGEPLKCQNCDGAATVLVHMATMPLCRPCHETYAAERARLQEMELKLVEQRRINRQMRETRRSRDFPK